MGTKGVLWDTEGWWGIAQRLPQTGLTVIRKLEEYKALVLGSANRMGSSTFNTFESAKRQDSGMFNTLEEALSLNSDVVGRCRLTVSNPELKARLVSGLDTKM